MKITFSVETEEDKICIQDFFRGIVAKTTKTACHCKKDKSNTTAPASAESFTGDTKKKQTAVKRERGPVEENTIALDELGLTNRTLNALQRDGLFNVHDVRRVGQDGVRMIKGFGLAMMLELEDAMARIGLWGGKEA